MVKTRLTLWSHEQSMKPERHQRFGKSPQELLQERCQLNRVVLCEINGGRVSIDRFHSSIQTSDVPILTENTLHWHIWDAISQRQIKNPKSSPICLIADITSSMKLGTGRVDPLAPSKESTPSLSTNTSSRSPKTTIEQSQDVWKKIDNMTYFFSLELFCHL